MSGETPVRVLVLSRGLGPGGAERLIVEQVAARSDAMSYEVAYLLPWKRHLASEIEALGVRTHCLNVRNEADQRWLVGFERLLRRGGFQVIHAHSPLSASLARLQTRARRRQIRFVYTEHNRWPAYQRVARVANWFTYTLNDSVFAVSDDVKNSVPARLRGSVETLVHGIDLDRVRAYGSERTTIRTELGVRDEDLLVVTVANYRVHKGYPSLLRAAAIVRDEQLPIRFVVVGQGQLQADVDALHAELGLEDTVMLLGYRDDAVRVIASADVFALASLHEGLPVAVMEAQALGIPVVATAVGGLTQAVTTGLDGILVRPGDPVALAAALRSMLDPELRGRMARAARESGERYASRRAVDRIEREFRRLAGITDGPAARQT